jgi:hypothetical protein
VSYCPARWQKQQEIDRLREENVRLKARLRYQERTAREGALGSQSEAGARTREVLMSVLHTLRKRTDDVTAAFQRVLDSLVQDPTADLYQLLFRSDSS